MRCPGATVWQISVDTGGTFTDGLARDPEGRLRRVKVLSSSALRASAEEARGRRLRFRAGWAAPAGFAAGARLRRLERPGGGELRVASSTAVEDGSGELELDAAPPAEIAAGELLELRFDEEAPLLAARLVTATPAGSPLPPLAMRLATTRGTNALLERRGAPTVFFVTRGFADLLRIGDQSRPDLFALDVRRPAPLHHEVVEVDERLAADGAVVEPLALEALRPVAEACLARGFRCAAVALLHSFRFPAHEARLAAFLRDLGFAHVSASAELAPAIGFLARAETAVVDATLSPLVATYLSRVGEAISGGGLHVMTSAGGLVRASRFRPKDSLLSGPAGGVVGAARAGREHGLARVIAFDMGGTSTDVARIDGDFEYLFEHRVGDARVAAPAIAVESVAAGGGSICGLDGRALRLGPESAGADPGPACYGAGGPLALSDVQLLLGRLDPSRFRIPLRCEAARAALAAVEAELAAHGAALAPERILQGYLAIADERMAEAIRRISVRRGYDPRDYALVAFGGAGGLHACAIARLLGIDRVLLPRDAGLLSAAGLAAAVVERFARRPVLAPLGEVAAEVEGWLGELAATAATEVREEGIPEEAIEVRRRLAFLRLAGQESTLEVEAAPGVDLARRFAERYREVYGYAPPSRPIELESLQVVAAERPPPIAVLACDPAREATPAGRRTVWCGEEREVPVYALPELAAGDRLAGPALVVDDAATLLVEDGWEGVATAGGVLLAARG